MTDQTPTPAQARLQELLEAVNEARRACEEEQRQLVRQEKAARINSRIDAQVEGLQRQINALQERVRVLERRRVVTEPQAQEAPTAPKTRTKGARAPRPEGTKRNYRTDRYLFHSAYQKRFRLKEHTHRILTAACKEAGIDPSDRSPENLDRMNAFLTQQAHLAHPSEG